MDGRDTVRAVPRIFQDVGPVRFPTVAIFNPDEPDCVYESGRRITIKRQHVQIMVLIAQGFSRGEIANRMNLSQHTVATLLRNIYATLNVNSSAQMVNVAYQIGLFVPTHTHLIDELTGTPVVADSKDEETDGR